jgi:hypothetical protein
MNSVHAIDRQISEYLLHLSAAQKKAILDIIKAFATDEEDTFEHEINRRIAEYESGAVKGYTFEESAERAKQAYNSSKRLFAGCH